MSILFSSIAALAIGASALLTVPADARTAPVVVTARDSDLPTRRVSYADLNLARQDGQRTLNLRVGAAISDVCGDSGLYTLGFRNVECRSTAWAGAKPQVANAIQRATDIAATGHSALPVAAITIVAN